jgi:hypothetical protein
VLAAAQRDQGDDTIGAYDDYSDYGTRDDSGLAIATILAVWAGLLLVMLVVVVASYVLIAIPLSALFRKTGIEPWKAWVPVYNTYEWLRLGGQNGHWTWFSLVPYGSVVMSVFLYMGMYRTGKAFGKDGSFVVLGIFLPVVWLFILGFGRDVYRPELLGAAGLGAPLAGHGSVAPYAERIPRPPVRPAV